MKLIVVLLLGFFMVSCTSDKNKKNGEVEIVLISAQNRDTIFKHTQSDLNDPVTFDCPKEVKEDAAILVVSAGKTNSYSIVVPIQPGAENRYKLSVPGHTGKNTSRFYHFSGNPFLDAYEALLVRMEKVGSLADTSSINGMIQELDKFAQKHPKASIIGYHIYSVETGGEFDELKKYFTPETALIWKRLSSKSNNGFTKELKRIRDAGKSMDCKKNDPNHFLIQSSNSHIDPSLLKDHVKVVVFWATWCGPCKQKMKIFSELNLKKYREKPFHFIAVSSEPDQKAVFKWMEQNISKYNGLSFVHDDLFCMANNYGIQQLPTVLVFDKKDKLVVRDPGMKEVEQMIDSLLRVK